MSAPGQRINPNGPVTDYGCIGDSTLRGVIQTRFAMKLLSAQSFGTGANVLFFLNLSPYRMNIKGTGSAKQATPPRMLIAGPTPKLLNIGRAAMGKPAANTLRRKVFALTAEAA